MFEVDSARHFEKTTKILFISLVERSRYITASLIGGLLSW